jgi:hypothetical protein
LREKSIIVATKQEPEARRAASVTPDAQRRDGVGVG